MFKTFEQFTLDHLLVHVQKEIPATEEDKQAYEHTKSNIHKYINEEDTRNLFLDGFDYLNSPVILDDFEEHIERRQWLKELEAYPDTRAHVTSNRLRVNKLSAINRIIAMPHFFLDMLTKPVPIISDRANEHIEYLRTEYQDLPIEKQIEFTQKTASLARLFIKHMIK